MLSIKTSILRLGVNGDIYIIANKCCIPAVCMSIDSIPVFWFSGEKEYFVLLDVVIKWHEINNPHMANLLKIMKKRVS